MKKITYNLTDAQKNCQLALEKNNNCLIIKSIRSGKTLTILDYAVKNDYKSILWIVPYLTNIAGLQEELEKWNIDLNIICITYNSIKKYETKHFDLVVLDECHRITQYNYQYLRSITYDKLIAMTGTYPKNVSKRELLHIDLKLRLVYTYSIKDAVLDGNVAPYNINIIIKKLSSLKTIHVLTKKYNFYTSETASYKFLISKILKSDGKQKMMSIFNMMRFLNTVPSTITFIKNYITANKSKRFIIFVATKAMAEQCSEYCYYGDKDDKYFNEFREGKINHLVLVEKATIGVTYNNLDGCLLTTINSSNSSVLQKIFRTILFRPNYTAQIDILINDKTIQQEWIHRALEDI